MRSVLGQTSLFVHLVHNLEPGYDGRMAVDTPVAQLTALHQLPPHLLHERGGKGHAESLSLSRAAVCLSRARLPFHRLTLPSFAFPRLPSPSIAFHGRRWPSMAAHRLPSPLSRSAPARAAALLERLGHRLGLVP